MASRVYKSVPLEELDGSEKSPSPVQTSPPNTPSPMKAFKLIIALLTVLSLVLAVLVLYSPNEVILPVLSPEIPVADRCVEEGWCSQIEFRFDKREVSTKETEYTCNSFQFPVDRTYHIVKFEPIIDDPALVHHISLYAADGPYSQETYFDCKMNQPIYHTYYIYFWGIGMPAYYYPADIGFRVGSDAVKHVWLQIHYNNPAGLAGQIDSSGLRITLAHQLRKHDASTLRLGATLPQIRIPPALPSFNVTGKCLAAKTQEIVKHPITVFANSFHMHTLGLSAYTKQYRNGKLIRELGRDNDYQFFSQTWDPLQRVTIEPGDVLETRCEYSSLHKKKLVKGGFSALEEMCWNTLMYYPPLGVWDFLNGHCISSANDDPHVPLV